VQIRASRSAEAARGSWRVVALITAAFQSSLTSSGRTAGAVMSVGGRAEPAPSPRIEKAANTLQKPTRQPEKPSETLDLPWA
jgi:hypothetical protein